MFLHMFPDGFLIQAKCVETYITFPYHGNEAGLGIIPSTEDRDWMIYKYSFCGTHMLALKSRS